jgi:hypothetical protein
MYMKRLDIITNVCYLKLQVYSKADVQLKCCTM